MNSTSTARELPAMSDNGQLQVLCPISDSGASFSPTLPLLPLSTRFEPQQLQVTTMASPARPVFVTKKELSFELPTSGDHAALVAGLDQRFRMFKLVVARLPKKFTPYKHEPSYRLTYYIEKLSCGHEQTYFPQAGPMSRRRHCAECASLALPPKKSCSSIGTEAICTKAIESTR